MNAGGQDLIKGRNCPRCGYDLTGQPKSDVIRCPECGRISTPLELIVGPPPGRIRRWVDRLMGTGIVGVVKIAIIALVLLAVLSLFLPSATNGPPNRRSVQLRWIATAFELYTQENNRLVPAHAGEMLLTGDFELEWLFDYDIPASQRQRTFGYLALETYDGSEDARAVLRMAIDGSDKTTPYYRLGDVWFVRWPEGWKATQYSAPAQNIQAWLLPNEDGARSVLFADGQVVGVDAATGPAVWAAAAAVRAGDGLQPLGPPPGD